MNITSVCLWCKINGNPVPSAIWWRLVSTGRYALFKTIMKIDWQNSTLGEVWSGSEWHRSTFLKANDYTCNIPLGPGHEYHYSEKCKVHGLEAGSNQWKLLDHFALSRRYLMNKVKEYIDRILNGKTDAEAIRKKLPSECDLYKIGTKWRKQDKWEMRNKDGSTYLVDNWLRNLPLGHLRGAIRDVLGAYKKTCGQSKPFRISRLEEAT